MAYDRIFTTRRRRRHWPWLLLLLVAAPALYALTPRAGQRQDSKAIQVVRQVQFATRPVAPGPPVSAQSAILMDADTGAILYERDAHARRPMASTTKIMTAILVLEHARPTDVVVASKQASETPFTGLYLKPGERITVEDLLWAILLRSANDACVAAGEHVAGTEAKFVEMMNAKARELGLHDTHFVNPHGLHAPGHYSSAYDLAVMARYGLQYPLFAEMVSRKRKRIERSIEKQDSVVVNKNRLLFRWDAADGIKTGYTRQAGHCLVASASKDGWRLIAVVLKSSDCWSDSRALLEYGFRHYQRVLIARRGAPLGTARVVGGVRETVRAVPAKDLAVVTPRGVQVAVQTQVSDGTARAPILRGDTLGTLTLREDDRVLGRTLLVAANAVAEKPRPGLVARMMVVLGGLFGLFALSAVARHHGRKASQSIGRRRRRF